MCDQNNKYESVKINSESLNRGNGYSEKILCVINNSEESNNSKNYSENYLQTKNLFVKSNYTNSKSCDTMSPWAFENENSRSYHEVQHGNS